MNAPAGLGDIALDELELFNRALAQSEIQAIYDAGPAGKCKQCATLGQSLDLTVNGSGVGGGVGATVTNPVTVNFSIQGGFNQEMFVVLNAPALSPPILWSYLNAGGQWIPLPNDLAQITPFSTLGPQDGTYPLFIGSLPSGPYDLYLAYDFLQNGHLDITSPPLCLNGAYDYLPLTVQ